MIKIHNSYIFPSPVFEQNCGTKNNNDVVFCFDMLNLRYMWEITQNNSIFLVMKIIDLNNLVSTTCIYIYGQSLKFLNFKIIAVLLKSVPLQNVNLIALFLLAFILYPLHLLYIKLLDIFLGDCHNIIINTFTFS